MDKDEDRILRDIVPERWKDCASPIGAVQSYIAELESRLHNLGEHPLYPPDVEEPCISGMKHQWQLIETAPRGSGENGPRDTRHPDYVQPPKVLIWTESGPVVGYYDWYYHEGYGRGAEQGIPAWRSSEGEPIYDATHWMPLPKGPT